MSKGTMYVGTNREFFNQAKQSAKSLKQYSDIQCAIVTTDEIKKSLNSTIFDKVIGLEDTHDDVRDKIFNLGKSPFKKTLYLDGDTVIVGDINPVFDLLDRVDIAAARSPHHPFVSIDGIPDAFPELNTGVIAYNNSKNVDDFFSLWGKMFKNQMEQGRPDDKITVRDADSLEEASKFGRMHGQPPFREALFTSEVEYSVLPSEYNFRSDGAYAYSEVKIIHMSNAEKLAPVINEQLGQRIYWENKLLVKDGIDYNFDIPILGKIVKTLPLKKSLRKIGLESEAKTVYDKFARRQ